MYKFKHKATGLYYTSIKHIKNPYPKPNGYDGYWPTWIKTNLSVEGKLYKNKTIIRSFCKIFQNHTITPDLSNRWYSWFSQIGMPEDFEIEEYQLKSIEK